MLQPHVATQCQTDMHIRPCMKQTLTLNTHNAEKCFHAQDRECLTLRNLHSCMDSMLASCFEQRTFHGLCLENNTQYITTSPTQLECMLFPARRHCCPFEIACTLACLVFMAFAAYSAIGKPCASKSSTPPTVAK